MKMPFFDAWPCRSTYRKRLLAVASGSLALDESVDGAGLLATAVLRRLVMRNWLPISGCWLLRDDDRMVGATALEMLRWRALFRWLVVDARAEWGFSRIYAEFVVFRTGCKRMCMFY